MENHYSRRGVVFSEFYVSPDDSQPLTAKVQRALLGTQLVDLYYL